MTFITAPNHPRAFCATQIPIGNLEIFHYLPYISEIENITNQDFINKITEDLAIKCVIISL